MKLSWHTQIADDMFMSDFYKKIRETNYDFSTTQYLVTCNNHVSKYYFPDGSWRNNFEFAVRLEINDKICYTLNDSFGNILINVLGRFFLYDNCFMASKSFQLNLENQVDNFHSNHCIVIFQSENRVCLPDKDTKNIAHFLKHKKFDTSYYPYKNEKDFFLL